MDAHRGQQPTAAIRRMTEVAAVGQVCAAVAVVDKSDPHANQGITAGIVVAGPGPGGGWDSGDNFGAGGQVHVVIGTSAPTGTVHAYDGGVGHAQPSLNCTEGEGNWAFVGLVPGLVLMILGTALIDSDAVYPLTIIGGSLILCSFVYHFFYRAALDDFCAVTTSRCCARFIAYLLCASSYAVWLWLAANPGHPTTVGEDWVERDGTRRWKEKFDVGLARELGLASVMAWILAWGLLWRESEQCRKAMLSNWLDRQPIKIGEASVAQLVAAAHMRGQPYFTAFTICRLEEKEVDGNIIRAVLEAEQVKEGPDTEDARNFLDDLFQGLSVPHKITAKRILREWVATGVPRCTDTSVSPLSVDHELTESLSRP